jgi:Uma2 family endonuclease
MISGEAFDSRSGFTLPNGAARSPNASWILSDRWNALSPEQQASFAPIVPDFVVELRSSRDTLVSLREKMEEYSIQVNESQFVGWASPTKADRQGFEE